MTDAYEESGVSIARGDAASADAFSQLAKTFNEHTHLVKGLVAFSADFGGMEEPMFAVASDGVGTKLKYAFVSGQHKTVGVDLVAMCVNDLVRNGIHPLGFALYRATGKINPEVMHDVVEGVVEGCLQAGCVYMSGETAEMPGFYRDGEYDLAGFAVGVFDREKLITGDRIQAGDVVFGIRSSGLHSNGFSLVRKLFPPELVVVQPDLLEEILRPTQIYVRELLEINYSQLMHGWAHITGGGIVGKLAKIIPESLRANIFFDHWSVPEIFYEIQRRGKVSLGEMLMTFNMGLGMIGVADSQTAKTVMAELRKKGQYSYEIGYVQRTQVPEKVFVWTVEGSSGQRVI